MKFWYLDAANKVAGPLSLDTISRMAATGEIPADPMVITERGTKWHPLSMHDEIERHIPLGKIGGNVVFAGMVCVALAALFVVRSPLVSITDDHRCLFWVGFALIIFVGCFSFIISRSAEDFVVQLLQAGFISIPFFALVLTGLKTTSWVYQPVPGSADAALLAAMLGICFLTVTEVARNARKTQTSTWNAMLSSVFVIWTMVVLLIELGDSRFLGYAEALKQYYALDILTHLRFGLGIGSGLAVLVHGIHSAIAAGMPQPRRLQQLNYPKGRKPGALSSILTGAIAIANAFIYFADKGLTALVVFATIFRRIVKDCAVQLFNAVLKWCVLRVMGKLFFTVSSIVFLAYVIVNIVPTINAYVQIDEWLYETSMASLRALGRIVGAGVLSICCLSIIGKIWREDSGAFLRCMVACVWLLLAWWLSSVLMFLVASTGGSAIAGPYKAGAFTALIGLLLLGALAISITRMVGSRAPS